MGMLKTSSLFLLILSSASVFGAQSPLQSLANSLNEGEWGTLTTSNLAPTIGRTGGASDHAITFLHQHGVWFPNHKKAMFVGGDHNGGNERLMIFDDNANTWSVGPTPPSGWQQNHAHGYNAGNPSANTLYFMLSNKVYDLNSGSWNGSIPNSPSSLGRANSSFAYWPGHGLLEFGAGGIWRYPDGGPWQTIASWNEISFGGSGTLTPFAIYNAKYNLIWFGGGDGENNNFKLEWKGGNYVVSQLPDPPLPEISGNKGSTADGIRSQIDYDPASGEFLLLDDATSPPGFYAFDMKNWRQLPAPPFTDSVDRIASFPVPDYSVNVFTQYHKSNRTATMHVYKHSDASGYTPPTGGGTDFGARCADSSVIRCFGFDSQTETNPYIDSPGNAHGTAAAPCEGGACARVVSNVKASGGGSLRFEIPSNVGADTSGAFHINFSDDPYPIQFGEGDEFYIQWKQRFSPEFIDTFYTGGGGWKQLIVGEGDRPGSTAYSCTQLEIVTQNTYQYKVPQMYHSCGGKDGQYQGLEVGHPSLGYLIQNAAVCRWRDGSPDPYDGDCVPYRPNQWMTFQVHVAIGTWYLNDGNYHRDSTIELWVAEEGKPSKLVISRTDYDIANNNPAAKYGKVWLTPFHTGKDSSQNHSTAFTWYDDLIISRTRIPDSTGTVTDDLKPSAPSNLRAE